MLNKQLRRQKAVPVHKCFYKFKIFMNTISNIIRLPRDQKNRVIFLVVVLVLILILVLSVILFGGYFFSQERQGNTLSENLQNEDIQAKQSFELDQIAKTLPQYSDEDIHQQYEYLDELKSEKMNINSL